jgi:hypothetical protein
VIARESQNVAGKSGKKDDDPDMRPLVDERALERFLEHADAREAATAAAALDAMAAACRLAAVQLEYRSADLPSAHPLRRATEETRP